jgi:flagellar biosynthesis protein FlhB
MAEGESTEAEDRTEAPTPRRLDRAREEGQVALSRDAVGFATLLAATLAAALALPPLGLEMLRAMRALLEAGPDDAESPGALVAGLLRAAGWVVLPVFLATGAAAVLATLAQTGWPRGAKALAPRLSKLNPLAGAKRILGPEGLAEMVRTLLKLGGVGAALWASVDLSVLAAALQRPPGALLAVAAEAAMRLLVATLLAFAVLAAVDLLWVRWRHLRQLRMSREEMREEMKESEGDPHQGPAPPDRRDPGPPPDAGGGAQGGCGHHEPDPLRCCSGL